MVLKRTRHQTDNLRAVLFALAAAAVVTLMIGVLGVSDRLDLMVQDRLYQHPKALDGSIILIGIDDRALDEFGPYNTWDRGIMASALERLAEDEDHLPSVVAIDTLYTGTTGEEDDRLADAASKLNVVTASFAQIGSDVIEDENGNLIYSNATMKYYSRPYEALSDVTKQGHINAVADPDGILRHALLFITPDDQKIYSMAYVAAGEYAKDHGITITEPQTENGLVYVSYSALPGGFYDGYSIADLIDGSIPKDAFEDRIVVIGPYAAGLQDGYFTSIDHGAQMFGMEYQANVMQMILDGEYKHELPVVYQLLILFGVCFIAFFIFQRTSLKVSSVIMCVSIAAAVAAAFAAYTSGTVVHPLWIPAGVFVLYLCCVIMNYVRATVERVRVTKTFERYVDPEIVKEILNEGIDKLSLGGKLCDIAVLFVDIRGFTAMSERLEPEKVVMILNRYLEMASGCVERNHGTLDKFVGDAMMAFWGAPIPQEDAAANAVQTAIEIIKGAKRVSDELFEETGEVLNVGVGVHCGPAVVGNMGAEKHMDYTAIGDTVNTAARLEAAAPAGTVYISRSVADVLGDRISFESLGTSVPLKGKSDFEVLRLFPDR